MSKDTDFPNIYFNDELIITNREMRIDNIQRRRRVGWMLRVLPRKMGQAARRVEDKIAMEILANNA